MKVPELDYRPSSRPHPELGIGVIGAGGVVAHAHLPAYREQGYRVLGIADVRAEAAESLGEAFGIPRRVTDYRRLLQDPEIRVVDVAIPGEGRVEVVRDVAAAGRHVLIQKPMADTLGDACEIVRIARDSGVRLAVNQNARWAPPYRATWSLLRQGFVGSVFHVLHTMQNKQDSLPRIREKWYARVPRYQILAYTVHYLDVVRFWMGREPERVTAHISRKPDQFFRGDVIATVVLDFGPEAQAVVVENNAAWPEREVAVNFALEGTEGTIDGDVQRNTIRVRHREWPNGVWEPPLEGRWFPAGFAGTMGDLLDAVADGREPAVSGEDNLGTLAIVEAAYRSAAEGRAVEPAALLPVGPGGETAWPGRPAPGRAVAVPRPASRRDPVT